jgi:hypothetical protein
MGRGCRCRLIERGGLGTSQLNVSGSADCRPLTTIRAVRARELEHLLVPNKVPVRRVNGEVSTERD